MIGRVLAFVACVALVAAETCNGDAATGPLTTGTGDSGCCLGNDYANQLQNAGSHSFPVAVFSEDDSGFLATAGGFKLGVKVHEAYWKSGGSGLASISGQANMPRIEIACMGNACPADGSSDVNVNAAPTSIAGTCMGLLTRHFAFSQLSGAASALDGNGAPSYVDDTSTSQTFVYAAVNVVQAANVYGETYNSHVIERLAIEVISFYFKFTKQIDVTATSTVTYASVQINVVLTQSSVTTNDLGSFIQMVDVNGADCTVADQTHGASFCGINPTVELEVGITTITNLPFMTVLHVADDSITDINSGALAVPLPFGINISAKDVASGLNLDTNAAGGSTQRVHTFGTVPASCDGACAVGTGNCPGSCALSYKAFLTYQRDVSGGTDSSNLYDPTDAAEVNTLNTQCQIVGAVLTVGNNGVGMDTIRYQEIQCRSDVDDATYGATGTNPDPPCPFAPDGQDADDNFQLTITISTSSWCPHIIADNNVVGFMTTSHDSYFDGNRLDIEVFVAATGASSGLDISKVAWDTLRGECADGTGDDCNVGGDVDGAKSTNSVYIIGAGSLQLGQTHEVDGVDNYDGCDQAEAANESDAQTSYNPYHCRIKASVYLCQNSLGLVADGETWTGGCPAASGTTSTAFEIDSDATSTKIVLVGSLKVGYPSIPIARKRTVEIKQGVEHMYALLQNTQGTAEAEVEAGISRAPTDEVEDIDGTSTETTVDGVQETVAVEEESNPMLIYIIVGVFLFISVFVGALVMYLRRSKGEKKQDHPVPITVEANKNTAAMA